MKGATNMCFGILKPLYIGHGFAETCKTEISKFMIYDFLNQDGFPNDMKNSRKFQFEIFDIQKSKLKINFQFATL